MKHFRKFYLIAALCAVVAIGIKYWRSMQNMIVVQKNVATIGDAAWNDIIVSSLNQSKITLSLDSNLIDLTRADAYVEADRTLMVSVDLLKKYLSCSVLDYANDTICIEKNMDRILLSVGNAVATVNDVEETLPHQVAKRDGVYYIPIEVVDQYLKYSCEWFYSVNSIAITNETPEDKIYPYKYDYREKGRVSVVKNQADLGTCWAFASLTALETSLLPTQDVQLSVDHMTWNSGFNVTQNEGGEYTMAMAYLLSWAGPVYEADDPYGDGVSPSGLSAICHVQEAQVIDSKDLDGVKRAVFLHGGVQSSLYMSVREADGTPSEHYNADNYSYCYIGTEKPNHDIVIIGWDDSYPAENFATVPEGNGAFICVNSWGEQFGDQGYFYVSYFDSNIAMHNLVYTDVQDIDNYDKIYQSDLCGWVGQLGYNRESAYFANVYEMEEDEEIRAVGFYATGPDTGYEVFLVPNYEDTSSLNERVSVAKGTLTNAGYYTIDLDTNTRVNAGTKCAVVVQIVTPNASRPVAVEYKSGRETQSVDLSDGEGYISIHGQYWEHVEDTQKCNICLKMYTDRVDAQKAE